MVDIYVVVVGFLLLASRLLKQKTKHVVVVDEANMYRATIRPVFPPTYILFSRSKNFHLGCLNLYRFFFTVCCF